MTRLREHRGNLYDSLETIVVIQNRADLVSHIRDALARFSVIIDADAVSIEPYAADDRAVGWEDTHVVTVKEYGVYGFTDGPVSQ